MDDENTGCKHGHLLRYGCDQCDRERALEDLRAARARIAELEAFARAIFYYYDCDEDAHRYGTTCRKCAAREVLKR